MKKISYSILLVLLLFVSFFSVEASASTTPQVDETEKIYDFAELLTSQEEAELYDEIQEFITLYQMDMVIVTIDDNPKSSARDYADDFYDYNDFGIGDTYDGLLMLIDMDNREVWISTTGNAILMYNDTRIDNILDYVQPNLSVADYMEASEDFIYYSSQYAKKGYPSGNRDYMINENGEYVKKPNVSFSSVSDILGFLGKIGIIPIIITIIIISIGCSTHKSVRKATSAKNYLKQDSFHLAQKQDLFLHTHTTKTYINTSSGSGGSSTHTSSSGRSHGGGGRGF